MSCERKKPDDQAPRPGVVQRLIPQTFFNELSRGGEDSFDIPYGRLVDYYRGLTPDEQIHFQDVMISCLRDLAGNQKSQFLKYAFAGDELLLLVVEMYEKIHFDRDMQPLKFNPRVERKTRENRKSAIKLLVPMLKEKRFLAKSKRPELQQQDNLHLRVCQTLVASEYEAPEKFWKDLIKYGAEYARYTYWGLAVKNYHAAVAWLAENMDQKTAVTAFMDGLFSDAIHRDSKEVQWAIETVLPVLPTEELRNELQQTRERIQQTVNPDL